MVKKRIVSVLLAGALTAGMGLQVNMNVQADDLQDAKNKASQQQGALDAAQAERLGERILTEQLESMVEPYGTVSSTLCSSRRRGDTLLVTLAAECEEEIAQTVPILTEEPGEDPETRE